MSALDLIAERYQYKYFFSGGMALFFRPAVTGKLQVSLAKLVLNPKLRRPLRACIALRQTPGVWRDHNSSKAFETDKES
jgi:hypothetical protein